MSIIYTNSKKKKQNRTPGWEKEQQEHEARCKRLGIDPYPKKAKKKFVEMKDKVLPNIPKSDIPSLGINKGSTIKKEVRQYNGERTLLGIAVMHKSNLVPVFDEQDAKDISKMRRG
ncbi:MAG: hypothetical protein ACXW2E_00640 [Nitrososphaeraceae archaeon]